MADGSPTTKRDFLTAGLAALVPLIAVVSYVNQTFVSRDELNAIREVVERAEAGLQSRIAVVDSNAIERAQANEAGSVERNQAITTRVDELGSRLGNVLTKLMEMIVSHQETHIACPAPAQ